VRDQKRGDKELQNKGLKLQMRSDVHFGMLRGLSFSFQHVFYLSIDFVYLYLELQPIPALLLSLDTPYQEYLEYQMYCDS
jgi:hypothetical protein